MQAIASSRKLYELFQGNDLQGSLLYKNLFSYSAQIETTNDGSHSINRKFGFSLQFDITQNNVETAQLKRNWLGVMNLKMPDEREFKFIRKGLFKQKYLIENLKTGEQIEVNPHFNWKQLRFDYEFQKLNIENFNLVCLIAVYALNYERRRGILLSFFFLLVIAFKS